ncbi:hypothetical protein [Arthrobacter sp. ISL-72]|nr:hypothetical protein [Arthrobacter sp. ISL-72]
MRKCQHARLPSCLPDVAMVHDAPPGTARKMRVHIRRSGTC